MVHGLEWSTTFFSNDSMVVKLKLSCLGLKSTGLTERIYDLASASVAFVAIAGGLTPG